MRTLSCLMALGSLCLAIACGSDRGEASATATPGPHFFFAQTPPANAPSACRLEFPEAIPLNAFPSDANKRYCMLRPGAYKIGVSGGNAQANVLLRYTGDLGVEVYASDLYPECLSNQRNFSLRSGGLELAYDNRHYLAYQLILTTTQDGRLMLIIDHAPTYQYGLQVFRCETCF